MNFLLKIFSFFKINKSPKIWAYKEQLSSNWVKVVSYKKPEKTFYYGAVIGPFRSEVDCEEFCDKSNFTGSSLMKYSDVYS